MTRLAKDPGSVPEPQATPAPRWKSILRLALGLGLLAVAWHWLLRHADLPALATRMGQLPAWAWALAGLALLGGHLARALRLRHEWRTHGDPGLAACLRMVLVHNAAVILVPLRAGEAGYVWLVHRQWGVGWRAAATSLLRWRLQDAIVLTVCALALLLPWSVASRTLMVLAFVLALLALLPPLWSWMARRGGLSQAQPEALAFDPWRGVAASAALWTLKIAANGGLLAALVGLPPETALRAGLGGELGGVQPLQPPAGLGTYEAGVWLAAGLPADLAPTVVAGALAVHAFSLAVALGAAAASTILVPLRPLAQNPKT